MFHCESFELSTKGFTDIIDITEKVESIVRKTKINCGSVTVSIPGSTAAITTIEYESGVLQDLKDIFENLVPQNKPYAHDKRWHDGNGYAHIRSALIGTTKTFPIYKGEILLGTWQQIVCIDFDNTPRKRKIIVNIVGE